MQKRFWIATKTDIHDAYDLKTSLLKEDPDRVIQVRRGQDGGNTVFRVVERFTNREAEVITDTKRRNKKRVRRVRNIIGATS